MAKSLVSMLVTAARKEEREKFDKPMVETEDYPWGLSINLGDKELAKLGLTEGLESDMNVDLAAKAFVTRSESSSVNGEMTRSATIQITDLAVAPTDERSAATKIFGEDDAS